MKKSDLAANEIRNATVAAIAHYFLSDILRRLRRRDGTSGISRFQRMLREEEHEDKGQGRDNSTDKERFADRVVVGPDHDLPLDSGQPGDSLAFHQVQDDDELSRPKLAAISAPNRKRIWDRYIHMRTTKSDLNEPKAKPYPGL
jgi:hypothetical protein